MRTTPTAIALVAATALTVAAASQAGAWTSLFDGKTTAGWHVFQGGKADASNGWTVEDGTLVALGNNGAKDLVSDTSYENFELEVDWKLAPRANSGIFFNVVEEGVDGIYASGPEYQLIDEDGWPDPLEAWQKAGADYAMHPPKVKAAKPVGQWNHTRIVVDRGHVTLTLNDQVTADYQMWTPEWDALRLKGKWKDYPKYGQAHRGKLGLQNHGNKIWFRNIRVHAK